MGVPNTFAAVTTATGQQLDDNFTACYQPGGALGTPTSGVTDNLTTTTTATAIVDTDFVDTNLAAGGKRKILWPAVKTYLNTTFAALAGSASQAFSATTAAAGTNTTQVATTAYADRLTAGTLAGAFTTLRATTTIGVGNATPAASGAGITFPATQSASSNANTLDDYEEGTWTPTIVGTTAAGAGTYNQQSGIYTKVGNLVYVTSYLAWSAHTGTGNMLMAGLPFTAGDHRSFAGIESNGLTATNPIGRVEVWDTYIALKEAVTATGVAIDTSVTYLFISSTYCV